MIRIRTRIPKRHSLVYFGISGLNLLRNYISESDAVVFQSPRVEINIWIALRALTYGRPSQATYYRSFLAWTKPTWVVTREDNSEIFYLTKRYLPTCRALSIQNGRRDSFSFSQKADFFSSLASISGSGPTIDVVATMGPPWSHYFHKALNTNTVRIREIGSVKNNATAISEGIGKGIERVLVVSSYPNIGSHQNFDDFATTTFGFWSGVEFTYAETFRIEAVLARMASEYAQRHSLRFAVLGKRPEWQPSEKRYFAQALGSELFEHIPLRTEASSYEAVRGTDLIVTSDSSLGYELFARGLRVAFVCGRMMEAGKPEVSDCDFGYPAIINKKGPFWTNSTDPMEFERVVSFAHQATETEWRRESLEIRDRVIIYDPENYRLCHVLNDLGIPNSGPAFWVKTLIPEK